MNPPPARRSVGATHQLRFPQLDRVIAASQDESILASARRAGVRIVGACGGRGTCGSCIVRVVEGRVHGSAGRAGRADSRRPAKRAVRACQVRPRSDCVIEVAARSLAPIVRADVASADACAALPIAPAVARRRLMVPPASLAEPSADSERLLRVLDRDRPPSIDLWAARALPAAARAEGGALSVAIRGDEIIDCGASAARTLGLAVDLGTTNVAAFLVDLSDGAPLASLAIESPQVAWGADLISRINHAHRNPPGAAELRESVVTAVNALAADLCHAAGARQGEIVDIALCGNTAMQHLFTGLPIDQLGKSPFVAAVREYADYRARDLGLDVCPGAYVHIAPNIGGFVGGDHVAALLATEPRWSTARASLVMDIGTNTEISVIHAGRIHSASCPSGPALEGGQISSGMRAAEGAIERVRLGVHGLELTIIGDAEPVGLCGSGVLDALAALRRSGAIDARGRISVRFPGVTEQDGRPAVALAPGVAFTQHDVRAVQLAKSAIRTGTELLLERAGLAAADLDRFIIAGAFGAYINVDSAMAIGLLPMLPADRVEQVGNAAGAGVRRLLVSQPERVRAAALARRCEYVELSALKQFQSRFLSYIGFPAVEAPRSLE